MGTAGGRRLHDLGLIVDDPRTLLDRLGLTQTGAARLLGIDGRTMRRYCDQPGAAGHRELPEPTRRLLLLMQDVPGVREWLEYHAD